MGSITPILDHLRIQHAADHLVKREGLGIGFLIAHPTPPHLGQLLPQRRQPGPEAESDLKHPN